MEIALSFRDTLEVDRDPVDETWTVRLCRPRVFFEPVTSGSLEFAVAVALAGTRYDVDVVLDRISVAA